MPVTLTVRTGALRRPSERFRRVLPPPGSGESNIPSIAATGTQFAHPLAVFVTRGRAQARKLRPEFGQGLGTRCLRSVPSRPASATYLTSARVSTRPGEIPSFLIPSMIDPAAFRPSNVSMFRASPTRSTHRARILPKRRAAAIERALGRGDRLQAPPHRLGSRGRLRPQLRPVGSDRTRCAAHLATRSSTPVAAHRRAPLGVRPRWRR